MAQSISIHVGLNHVDPAHYGGPMTLRGCINDANAMQKVCAGAGISRHTLLLDEKATAGALTQSVQGAAAALGAGDLLVITFSGHGGMVEDHNHDESDGLDETWCLYDRMVPDDELYGLWAGFRRGVRILLVSDSCHSGTVARMIAQAAATGSVPDSSVVRSIGTERSLGVYRAHAEAYDRIQRENAAGRQRDVEATLIQISACQDWQVAIDTPTYGVFTDQLLKVWSAGTFSGDHIDFHAAIYDRLGPSQRPGYLKLGRPDADFERSRPFGIPAALSDAA